MVKDKEITICILVLNQLKPKEEISIMTTKVLLLNSKVTGKTTNPKLLEDSKLTKRMSKKDSKKLNKLN